MTQYHLYYCMSKLCKYSFGIINQTYSIIARQQFRRSKVTYIAILERFVLVYSHIISFLGNILDYTNTSQRGVHIWNLEKKLQ